MADNKTEKKVPKANAAKKAEDNKKIQEELQAKINKLEEEKGVSDAKILKLEGETAQAKTVKTAIEKPVERRKKQAVINSIGVTDKMLPKKTNKTLATYQLLSVGEIDPLTTEEVLPPPVIIPPTYTLYDKFEEDPNKSHKVMTRVGGIQHRLNKDTNKFEQIQTYKDVEFNGGTLLVNIKTQWNLFVFMELHPLNESNRFRGSYPNIGEAVFKRLDTEYKSNASVIADADLAVDAELTVKSMKFDKVRELALALKLPVEGVEPSEIRWSLRLAGRKDPRKFFSTHPDRKLQIKVRILDALQMGVLEYIQDSRKFKFMDESKPFFTAALGKESVGDLVEYLNTKDGASDLQELMDQLKAG